EHDYGSLPEQVFTRFDLVRTKAHVAARNDGDLILARAVDRDEGDAGGSLVVDQQGVEVDAVPFHASGQIVTKDVFPHFAYEVDAPAQAGAGGRLVCSLASGEHGEIIAQHRLTGPGKPIGLNDHVHVRAADYEHVAPGSIIYHRIYLMGRMIFSRR